MADLIPCPSCKATLKIPAGAGRIRCPQCKTEVNVGPPAPPKAPPPPVKQAIPLPFDKPPTAKALPSLPKAKPVPVEKPVRRGRVVREDEDDEPKQRSRKREYEDELKKDKNYEQVAKECKMARIGVRLLSVAAASSVSQSLTFAFFLATIAIAAFPEPITFFLTMVGLGGHGLFLLAGYFCCAFGPKGMRGTAIIGMVVTVLHAALIIPLAFFGVMISAQHLGSAANPNEGAIPHAVFCLSSSVNNLTAFTDFPWMILLQDFVRGEGKYVLMMMLGSLLEFTKMSILGTMVQYYASEGKSFELSFKSLKFVYRIIWVIVVVAIAKVAILILFFLFGGAQSVQEYYRIPQTLLTVSYFLWWAFAWYGQYQTMTDTIEVITPSRYLDSRRSLDTYY